MCERICLYFVVDFTHLNRLTKAFDISECFFVVVDLRSLNTSKCSSYDFYKYIDKQVGKYEDEF